MVSNHAAVQMPLGDALVSGFNRTSMNESVRMLLDLKRRDA